MMEHRKSCSMQIVYCYYEPIGCSFKVGVYAYSCHTFPAHASKTGKMKRVHTEMWEVSRSNHEQMCKKVKRKFHKRRHIKRNTTCRLVSQVLRYQHITGIEKRPPLCHRMGRGPPMVRLPSQTLGDHDVVGSKYPVVFAV